MDMKKDRFNVKGMHCGSCEMLVKEDLLDIDGVVEVKADHKSGDVEVSHEGVNLDVVKKAIEDLGYKVEKNG